MMPDGNDKTTFFCFLVPQLQWPMMTNSFITTACGIQTRDLSFNEENYISDCMYNSLSSALIQCSVLQSASANKRQKHTSAASDSINHETFNQNFATTA